MCKVNFPHKRLGKARILASRLTANNHLQVQLVRTPAHRGRLRNLRPFARSVLSLRRTTASFEPLPRTVAFARPSGEYVASHFTITAALSFVCCHLYLHLLIAFFIDRAWTWRVDFIFFCWGREIGGYVRLEFVPSYKEGSLISNDSTYSIIMNEVDTDQTICMRI